MCWLWTTGKSAPDAARLNSSPGIEGGNWVGLSKPYNGMNASKALSPVNRNPCIGEAFLVRKWLDPSTKLRIERIDEDVIRQQALNDGAAMLIVG